jgi:hypothetical protein
MKKNLLTSFIGFAVCVGSLSAQLIITDLNTPYVIDFTGFDGSGFAPNPSAGQLDSDTWVVTGLSDGNSNFGGTYTSGDWARGASNGGVSSGGVYAFNTGTSGVGLGVQPGGSDFTLGSMILEIENATGTDVTLDLSYDIFYLNNEARGNSFNFAYSSNFSDFTSIGALDFTSPAASDELGWQSVSRSTSISATISAGSTFWIAWSGDDVSGSGSRDEFALDNISISAVPEPSTYALLAGLGMIGFVAYRRRKAAAQA